MAGLGFVVGGAVEGFGRGMAQQGMQKREEAMARAREEAQSRERQQDRDFRSAEAQKQRDFSAEQAERDRADRTARDEADRDFRRSQADADRQSRMREIEARDRLQRARGGSGGGQGGSGDGGQPDGMTADEQRAWNAAVQRETYTDEIDGSESVDWDSVSRRLKQQGFDRIADLARSPNSGVDYAPNLAPTPQYQNPEAVRDAYSKGQITREEAARILEEVFGYER